ncbi:hypothetical protein MA16_Dca001702 [Dendrobium catenatum]|uniref:CCHC-type domain-containing protein n=1 Tax=Dendrobium catenatum TaxID=906689 RepID=A0A2I0WN76_9ASPA|nr:hypothetical protein MA16_Dca001702 [Dendrobium catenatum]
MAESSRRVAPGGDNSLEALWTAHRGLGRRTEELEMEVNRFYEEIRQELRAITVRLDRLALNRNAPTARQGLDINRGRQREVQEEESSDSDLEINGVQNSELSDSGEEIQHFRRRRPRETNRSHGEFRVKMDIPFFDGKLHIEDYLDWERSVETFFEYMEIEPIKQVRYVACRLKAGASAWWQQILQSRRREGRGAVRSWRRMKQLLRGHYLPTDYEQMLYQQYQHCRQGNRSVNDYTEEFYRLSARNNLNETANQLVARYIGGLKDSIQDKLELNSVWSLSQAVNYALKVEMQALRHNRNYPFKRTTPALEQTISSHRSADPNGKIAAIPAEVSGAANASGRTNETRTFGRGKTTVKDNPYAKNASIKCFRCFQVGHKSNECPSRPQLQLIEADEEEGSEHSQGQEQHLEDVEGDVGEPLICVMQKLLVAPRQPCSSQRNALFRTKCTIGGNVCDLLIDSG